MKYCQKHRGSVFCPIASAQNCVVCQLEAEIRLAREALETAGASTYAPVPGHTIVRQAKTYEMVTMLTIIGDKWMNRALEAERRLRTEQPKPVDPTPNYRVFFQFAGCPGDRNPSRRDFYIYGLSMADATLLAQAKIANEWRGRTLVNFAVKSWEAGH